MTVILPMLLYYLQVIASVGIFFTRSCVNRVIPYAPFSRLNLLFYGTVVSWGNRKRRQRGSWTLLSSIVCNFLHFLTSVCSFYFTNAFVRCSPPLLRPENKLKYWNTGNEIDLSLLSNSFIEKVIERLWLVNIFGRISNIRRTIQNRFCLQPRKAVRWRVQTSCRWLPSIGSPGSSVA